MRPAGGSPSGCACDCSPFPPGQSTGRRRLLHLAATAPFTALALQALAALTRLIAPARFGSG